MSSRYAVTSIGGGGVDVCAPCACERAWATRCLAYSSQEHVEVAAVKACELSESPELEREKLSSDGRFRIFILARVMSYRVKWRSESRLS